MTENLHLWHIYEFLIHEQIIQRIIHESEKKNTVHDQIWANKNNNNNFRKKPE